MINRTVLQSINITIATVTWAGSLYGQQGIYHSMFGSNIFRIIKITLNYFKYKKFKKSRA